MVLTIQIFYFWRAFRSPHGFADINMQTMCQQLQREEENLCAQRGLVQGQDTQTFSIFFHETLSDKWRKLVKNQVTSIYFYLLSVSIDLIMLDQSSGTSTLFFKLNEFFTSFLDHVGLSTFYNITEVYKWRLIFKQAFRELDYEVRDRHFLETVLDIEMWWNMSQNERSIFYNGTPRSNILRQYEVHSITCPPYCTCRWKKLFRFRFVLRQWSDIGEFWNAALFIGRCVLP